MFKRILRWAADKLAPYSSRPGAGDEIRVPKNCRYEIVSGRAFRRHVVGPAIITVRVA